MRCLLLVVAGVCAACGPSAAPDAPPVFGIPLPSCAETTAVRVDTLARGLDTPWDIEQAPDGTIFITERPGRIRVWRSGVLDPEPWARLPAVDAGENGLMGLALAPDFATSREVYAVATVEPPGARSLWRRAWRRLASRVWPRASLPFQNRVYRWREANGAAGPPELVVSGLPADQLHAGGLLDFGPDGLLYVSLGEGLRSSEAPRRRSPLGKVLRYDRAGAAPAANPWPGSPVYAVGVRNPQGLAWLSDGAPVFIDHGPSGLPIEGYRYGHDELNVLRAGADYGWPETVGPEPGTPTPPIAVWTPGPAPAGLAAYHGPYAPWRGNVFVAGLKSGAVHRVRLAADSAGVRTAVCEERMLVREYGRLRAVAESRQGGLLISTSNADGRGTPGPHGDLLLSVTPSGR